MGWGVVGAQVKDLAQIETRITSMTKTMFSYLGKPASVMLADVAFKLWPVEKSFEDDLEEPIIHYVFPQHGLELRCDGNDRVSTIFLYADEFGGFDECLFDIPFSSNRQQVTERFGSPLKSGGELSDPILGEYGAWNRFTRLGHEIHVEYRADADRIKMITLFRTDVVS